MRKDCTKTAFTLAEVLITLAVIGVVAAMSIPALMQNKNDAEAKAALKKSYATLSGAMKSILSEEGGTIKGLYATNDGLKNGFAKYMNVVKDCDYGASVAGSCWPSEWTYYSGGAPASFENLPAIITNDGMMYKMSLADSVCNDDNGSNLKNGITQCGYIFIDVNSFKKPNKIGKDIFIFHLLENRILPYGGSTSTYSCSGDGLGCTAEMLTGN